MITDHKYVDTRVDDLRTYLLEMRRTDAVAMASARDALNSRLAGMNEFRKAITEQAQTFIPRPEAEAVWRRNGERMDLLSMEHRNFVARPEHDALASRLNAMEVRITRAEGTDTGVSERTASLRQTIVTTVAVVGLFLTLILALVGYVLR